MKFLVELDQPMSGQPLSAEAERAFVERVVFPTLDRAEQLVREGCILAGGPVAGRVALRFVVDVESAQQLDLLITSLPLWTVAHTRVTPLIEFSDRRAHVSTLLQHGIPLVLPAIPSNEVRP